MTGARGGGRAQPVAMCDSSRPGRPDGLLEDETLDWLGTTLAVDRPVEYVPGWHCTSSTAPG